MVCSGQFDTSSHGNAIRRQERHRLPSSLPSGLPSAPRSPAGSKSIAFVRFLGSTWAAWHPTQHWIPMRPAAPSASSEMAEHHHNLEVSAFRASVTTNRSSSLHASVMPPPSHRCRNQQAIVLKCGVPRTVVLPGHHRLVDGPPARVPYQARIQPRHPERRPRWDASYCVNANSTSGHGSQPHHGSLPMVVCQFARPLQAPYPCAA
ncbi:hypothetical protein QBC39DRAFT_339905 [Podospora conica]|nr:hypothetical protein QBC39DRAFT_339905 [Schizothecium conicum]